MSLPANSCVQYWPHIVQGSDAIIGSLFLSAPNIMFLILGQYYSKEFGARLRGFRMCLFIAISAVQHVSVIPLPHAGSMLATIWNNINNNN